LYHVVKSFFERKTMEQTILSYNRRDVKFEETVMPKRKVQLEKGGESFGERLGRLRKDAGYSLRELANEVGISHRMLVYYEKHAEHPPTHLMPQLAKVLGVSTDQLLGVEKVKGNGRARDTKLWRRFSQVEKLPPPKRKQIVQILDAFLGSEKAKKVG
jgi:transcriptional regulator with XRE-family HTH domain